MGLKSRFNPTVQERLIKIVNEPNTNIHGLVPLEGGCLLIEHEDNICCIVGLINPSGIVIRDKRNYFNLLGESNVIKNRRTIEKWMKDPVAEEML